MNLVPQGSLDMTLYSNIATKYFFKGANIQIIVF